MAFGLDVVFPAAMAALTVGLIADRKDLAAALLAVVLAVAVGLVAGPAIGAVAAAVMAPLAILIAGPSETQEALA
jgi:predicted branched-subunit amino acid permease